jgi:hypothetical protein
MSLITIKTANSKRIYDPYEVVTNFGTVTEESFLLCNDNIEPLSSCKIYFEKTESLGDLDNPGTLEPYIDFEHILKMGNEKIADPTNIGCLKIIFDGNEHIVSSGIASKKSNGISLGSFLSGETKTVVIKMEAPASYSSRRFFVNMVVQ